MREEAGSRSSAPGGDAGSAQLEHVMRSLALPRLAGGVAHDVKNALNALALQVAILGEKLASTGPPAAAAAAEHLPVIRDQIRRASEVVRGFADLVEPPSPRGWSDLGGLAADGAARFQHEAQRRGIELACDSVRDAVRARCDPARAARIVLGLLWKALAETPTGGRVTVRAAEEEGWAAVVVRHTPGPERPELAFFPEAAAAAAGAMGGRLAVAAEEGAARLELRLPRSGTP